MARKRKTSSMLQEHPMADAVALLEQDHRNVQELFKKYEAAGTQIEKRLLARQICLELIVHTKLGEEIFYPAYQENSVLDDLIDEAQVERDSANVLINELLSLPRQSASDDAKVSVPSGYVDHHGTHADMAAGMATPVAIRKRPGAVGRIAIGSQSGQKGGCR